MVGNGQPIQRPGQFDGDSKRGHDFLALGKAIISTPLTRQMPAPLVHGEHVHFVDGSPEQIEEAIQRICNDAPYRRRLEQAARDYYVKYLQPTSVIRRILAHDSANSTETIRS